MSQKGSLGAIRKYFELNEYENMYQNLWDAGKAVLRGKFTQLKCSYLKWESYQTNNLA